MMLVVLKSVLSNINRQIENKKICKTFDYWITFLSIFLMFKVLENER